MKILLWKVGALGDVLMTTPLIRQLRAHLPQAHLSYLVGQSAQAALHGNPHLDRIVTFDERILIDARLHHLGRLLPLLRGYDAIFVLDKHWIFTCLAWLVRAPLRIGFQRRWQEGLPLTHAVPYGPLRHEIDYYLDLMEVAGWPTARNDIALEPPSETAFTTEPDCVVLINSGGNNPHEQSEVRRMPDALFGALVETCAARHQVSFIGSAAEVSYYKRFSGAGRNNLCGRTSLAEATSLLRQAGQVVTTDTGLMHLSAAVNPNVTAVFGPTHPQRKCPPGARWVWLDEAQYDARYELFGTLPHGSYFSALNPEKILGQARPSPFADRFS